MTETDNTHRLVIFCNGCMCL